MKIAKIKIDRDLCIGAAPCVSIAPEVFDLDDENKAVLKKKNGSNRSEIISLSDLEASGIDKEMLLIAAQSCPTKAIFLYDEDGKQIYP